MSTFVPPSGYRRIKLVNSFEELISTRFEDGVNALCWQRDLPGDYEEVVRVLNPEKGIVTLEEDALEKLPVSDAGKTAIASMLEDLRRLREHDLLPVLDSVNGYVQEEETGPVRTDVCSFHADSANAEADTWLCTYFGTTSEGLANEDAIRRIDVPETRAALLAEYGGEDDADFAEYLHECCYDLHYVPATGALRYSFGVGNLWRIATEYPDAPVPPCIHRAPDPVPGQLPRLLLIG